MAAVLRSDSWCSSRQCTGRLVEISGDGEGPRAAPRKPRTIRSGATPFRPMMAAPLRVNFEPRVSFLDV